jgi:phage-related protein
LKEQILYNIIIYQDEKGNEPIKEYLQELYQKSETSKDARIKRKKIFEYLDILKTYGITAGEPYIKNIEGNIWELRPLTDRIFFFFWQDDAYVLLHHFVKKTQKTPRKEIIKAKNNLENHLARNKK